MRFLALLAIALFPTGVAASLSEADRAFFAEAAMPGAAAEARTRAGKLAHRLAREGNLDALDALLALGDAPLLRRYAGGWTGRSATPEFEARVLAHFSRRDIAAALIPALDRYRNAELFEAMYRDAEALAAWRAKRRRECRARIVARSVPVQARARAAIAATPALPAGAKPPVRGVRATVLPGAGLVTWHYDCGAVAGDDDPLTDLDARPLDAWGNPGREHASVAALARTAIPDVEARLDALFADLSLYPSADWRQAGGPPPGVHFPTARPPLAYLQLFRDRRYRPEVGSLAGVIREVVPNDDGATTDKDAWWTLVALHGALATTDSPEATRLLVASIERAATIGNAQDRRQFVSWLIPLLGPVLPPAQADLAALEARLTARLPREEAAECARLFARAREDNRSLREPSADSLTRWIDHAEHARLIAYLLAHGASPDGPRSQQVQPPLVMAAYANPSAAAVLLGAGADVNIRGPDGGTPLHAACDSRYGKPERAALAADLIARGAKIDARSEAGQLPLHRAASGSPECVRLLLAAGAQVEAADGLGRTPLEWAASNNSVATARLLLDAGADPNRENRDGGSAYVAAYEGKPEVKALLEARGGRLTAVQIANRARAKLLIEWYTH